MARLLFAFLLGTGCRPDHCEGADCAQDEPVASAPAYETETPEPEWSATEVGEILAATFSQGPPDPFLVGDTFLDLMAEGDATCPGDTAFLNDDNLLGCTAESGHYYAGIAWHEELVNEDEGATFWTHGGDYEILRPDGSGLRGGGAMHHRVVVNGENPDKSAFELGLQGSWHDDAAVGWLGEGFSGVFLAEGKRNIEIRHLEIAGGIAVGERDLHLELAWDMTGVCGTTAMGSIHLRDDRGYWYTWELGEDCDTCGQVTFHEIQELGELCLDFQDYTDAFLEILTP